MPEHDSLLEFELMASNGGFLFKGSVFSHDAKHVLSPSGCRLKIHSAQTCELTGVLEGHEADVTTIALNPKQPGQVYSASKDGTIKLWDYKASECLATLPIRETVRSMVRLNSSSSEIMPSSLAHRPNPASCLPACISPANIV